MCGGALFGKKTSVTVGFAALFAAVSVWKFLQRIAEDTVADCLLLSSPYIAATVVFAMFAIADRLKRNGTVLMIAGAVMSTALAVLMIMVLNWLFALPAFVSAAVCAGFAVKSKNAR
ncbi:MAG: hypothetical protein K2J80_01310 [Oscillospiraceae bacterium]|nr:hypothetical protein [Oscillospiraceae bacterium]